MTIALGQPEYPQTPTLDKVLEVHDRSQAIGEFLEWLEERGVFLAYCPPDSKLARVSPYPKSKLTLLHEYFEIDPQQEERERRAVLEYVSANQERAVDFRS